MKRLLRRLYDGWCAFGRGLGVVNMTILLTLVYWLILPVFALVRFSDPLRTGRRRRGAASHWQPSAPPRSDLAGLYRPF
jgi:hypothetical protein